MKRRTFVTPGARVVGAVAEITSIPAIAAITPKCVMYKNREALINLIEMKPEDSRARMELQLSEALFCDPSDMRVYSANGAQCMNCLFIMRTEWGEKKRIATMECTNEHCVNYGLTMECATVSVRLCQPIASPKSQSESCLRRTGTRRLQHLKP